MTRRLNSGGTQYDLRGPARVLKYTTTARMIYSRSKGSSCCIPSSNNHSTRNASITHIRNIFLHVFRVIFLDGTDTVSVVYR